MKDNADLFEGDYVLVQFRPFEADAGSSSLDAYKEWMGKNGNDHTELAMVGWINADLAYQGIKAAGPGLRPPVGDRRHQQDDELHRRTASSPPIDWSRQHEAPTQDDPATHGPKPGLLRLVQVKDGAFQMVGRYRQAVGRAGPATTRDWSEPTSMDFSS